MLANLRQMAAMYMVFSLMVEGGMKLKSVLTSLIQKNCIPKYPIFGCYQQMRRENTKKIKQFTNVLCIRHPGEQEL